MRVFSWKKFNFIYLLVQVVKKIIIFAPHFILYDMAKKKTAYFCSSCGCEEPKWFGKCPSCGEWGTCVEEIVDAKTGAIGKASRKSGGVQWSHGGTLGLPGQKERPKRLSEIEAREEQRIDMHDDELNRVLGGGLVPGSMVLLGGDPGIGKSTLVLQTVMNIKDKKILYCSGEESAYQLKLRASRLAAGVIEENPSEEIEFDNVFIACETNLDDIFAHVANVEPDILVIDSIQTIATDDLESSAGSVGQVRECAARILKFAKESNTPVILIGHITKEGSLAGPKVLEHIVDTVLQFEGDQHYMYRILRAIKNRFGSTSELGIYEMLGTGLRQVTNPSELLLKSDHKDLSGIAIAAAIEGMRPFLIETQALVSTSVYATAMRSTTGFDQRRLNMLLAVLEKKVGFKLAQKDVFLNIAGGLRVSDPAMDLAVMAAILSSNMDMPLPTLTCMTGEVGLSGEIRPVARLEQRIREAEKLGFERILIPNIALKSLDAKSLKIQLCPVSRVDEAFRLLFK
jgi:DNA repair protein RadA/Sms